MDILIVGGGLSGLFAARELLKENHFVTIIESEEKLGGLASSFFIKNKWIPKTYHHFLPNEKTLLNVVSELGFKKNILWNNSSVCFWYNKKPYRLTMPQDIFFFKPLKWISRIKFIRLGLLSLFRKNWHSLSKTDGESWIKKIAGKETAEKLFKPLARIKFGELSSVSAAWLGERLHEAAINREKYAYLDCGLQKFIDAIGNDIKHKGGKIYLNSQVEKIDGNKVYVKINGKRKLFQTEKIIFSAPPPILKKISKLSKKETEIINRIKYKPMVCMVASSKNLITPFYWNVFITPKKSFGGIFNHTALFPKGGINGENLYYIFSYLDEKDDLYTQSEDQIEKKYLADLKDIQPDFEYSWTKIFREKYSSPIYSMDYRHLPIKFNDVIYITGVHRMYPNTRTMNNAARSGIITAKFILEEAKKHPLKSMQR